MNSSLSILKKLNETKEVAYTVYKDNVGTFNTILTEWDFIQEWTGTDVTSPHIECIEVDGDKIHVECELWDPDLDDYVFCDGGDFEAPEIVKMLDDVDFNKSFNVYEDAKPIYSAIAQLVDWDKVSDTLYDLVRNELNIQEKEN